MSEQMRKEFEKLFDEFAAKYDQHSDAWQDMPLDEVFIAGCIASRQALVIELPAERDGYAQQFSCYEVNEMTDALDKAGVSYR